MFRNMCNWKKRNKCIMKVVTLAIMQAIKCILFTFIFQKPSPCLRAEDNANSLEARVKPCEVIPQSTQ